MPAACSNSSVPVPVADYCNPCSSPARSFYPHNCTQHTAAAPWHLLDGFAALQLAEGRSRYRQPVDVAPAGWHVHLASSNDPPVSGYVTLEDIVPFLLSYPEYLNQRALSNLICCSKSLGRSVQQYCPGTLAVGLPQSCTAQAVIGFAQWLSKYGHTVRSLSVNSFSGYWALACQQNATALAAALQAVAASPKGVRLQQYHSTSEDSSTPTILAQLPTAHLTSLQVSLPVCESSDSFNIITKLKHLATLRLSSQQQHPATHGLSTASLPQLCNLQHLTALSLQHVLPADGLPALHHLPASLQLLQITNSQGPRQGLLALDHLKVLRQFTLQYSRQCQTLQEDDSLPVGLQQVHLGHCSTVEPLLALSGLQQLSLVNTPEAQLSKLTKLTTLNKLTLTYDGPPHTGLYISIKPQLKVLQELRFSNCLLKGPGALLLGQLLGLTRLVLINTTTEQSVVALARALGQLTNLQELVIQNTHRDRRFGVHSSHRELVGSFGQDWPCCLGRLFCEEASAFGGFIVKGPELLLDGIVHLATHHLLRSLHLDVSFENAPGVEDCNWRDRFAGTFAGALAAATKLTRLSIGGDLFFECFNENVHLPLFSEAIVQHLTSLRSLRIAHDVRLSDASLCVLAQKLTGLTHLDIGMVTAPVAAVGIAAIKSLKKLEYLGLGPRYDARTRRSLGLPTTVEQDTAWYGVAGACDEH